MTKEGAKGMGKMLALQCDEARIIWFSFDGCQLEVRMDILTMEKLSGWRVKLCRDG
jgi:hypothetical protein